MFLVRNNPYLVHESQNFEDTIIGQPIHTWLDVYNQPEPSRNVGVGIVDLENLGPHLQLNVGAFKKSLLHCNVYIENYEQAFQVLIPSNVA